MTTPEDSMSEIGDIAQKGKTEKTVRSTNLKSQPVVHPQGSRSTVGTSTLENSGQSQESYIQILCGYFAVPWTNSSYLGVSWGTGTFLGFSRDLRGERDMTWIRGNGVITNSRRSYFVGFSTSFMFD